MSTSKGVPLTKDEVSLLLDLIEANKIIISKATNASNNQLKDAAWSKLTDAFNASVSSCPRRTEQLKLKWENLKKTARKRSTKIRMNLIKTGGGKPDYIPPDEALDRVASILGATCEGFTVPVGGDSEVVLESAEDVSEGGGIVVVLDGGEGSGEFSGGGGDGINIEEHNQQCTPKPKKFFFNTPSGNNSNKQKRQLVHEDIRARTARNQSIAEYYTAKRKKIELEMENIDLINKKLRFELEQNK